ncbi:rhodanese-like domain-containing protein [Alicyclobacillus ferrooxydans]|uniref:Rhodanese domain-containing protein n=1 Tax=Alicyclobacillus ferrooxydans TaxID=471514 RepID=A0A0P9CV23_9BACL|nr:rhodanese-like domain-containing protein [Alicyclobacillus ferrooxydans]KPV43544.1 hypothetical protein AN477_12115 [Alicyclobacillus ferrooxydans]
MPFETDGIPQYTKEELKQILQEGKKTVIDVRTPEEYESGHIPNVPLKPMQEVEQWSQDLPKAAEYLFICRSGGRSQKVAQFLKQQGFDVANFNGGMLSWDGELTSGKSE